MEGKPIRPANGNPYILISHKRQTALDAAQKTRVLLVQARGGPGKLAAGGCSLVGELHRKGIASQFLAGFAVFAMNDKNIFTRLKSFGIKRKLDHILRRLEQKRNG